MATTHFAAIRKNQVVGVRSSTSRSAECPIGHKFGPYSHAVYFTAKTTKTAADGTVQVSDWAGVTTWHGGAKNAQAGLRAINRFSKYDDYQGGMVQVERTNVELVPVLMLPKKPKVGQLIEVSGRCERCGGIRPVGQSCGCFDNGGE